MASDIQYIQDTVKEEIKIFEKQFRQAMKTNVFLLDNIMSFIVKRKGKQIRCNNIPVGVVVLS